jgi:hypothetical protein
MLGFWPREPEPPRCEGRAAELWARGSVQKSPSPGVEEMPPSKEQKTLMNFSTKTRIKATPTQVFEAIDKDHAALKDYVEKGAK